ncbi:hypothetical protein Clacol_007260 [Clathrus columnatus]|uniref:F-box domain-containing protein n=1 Tax=Clathrus columnatus TaxID=1419009 RepID=A0AAV5AKN7_9AGAM|nr:hypothetical protein Clacol_007260 [Clathrus columnatus]
MPRYQNINARHPQRHTSKPFLSKKPKRMPSTPKSPRILTLPPEILSYIFELGNLLSETGPDDVYNPFPHFAVLCSHVSQYFRTVALSTPQLWTYIDFREGFPYETAHIFLERSKEAPLTLDVDLTTGSESLSASRDDHRYIVEDMIEQSIQIHSMIAPHAHRWKHFDLKADYYEIIWYWLLELAKIRSAPYLENLGIFCHEDWKSSEEFQPRELRNPMAVFAGGTPRIRSVDLWGVHLDWNAITLLRGLKILRLAWHTRDVGLTAAQFTQTLKECPDLHELSLQQSGPLIGTWPGDRITLSHLKVLELAYLELDIAIEIFRHIRFPVLEELLLDLEQDSVEPFIEAFASCYRFHTIQSLKLRSFQCSISKAKLFLLRMPNLTFMNLNFHYLTSNFVEALMHRHHPVCTKLNTLKLSGLGMGRLKKLLRCRPTNTITTLHLDETDNWEKSEIRWLNKAVKSIQFYTSSDDEEVDGEEEGSEESEDEDDVNSGQSVYNVGDYVDFDMYDDETNYYD